MNVAVDPCVLAPPTAGNADFDSWVLVATELATVVGAPSVRGFCPRPLVDDMYSNWWDSYDAISQGLRQANSPYTPHDLFQLLDQVAGRLAEPSLEGGRSVLLTNSETDPEYAPPGSDNEARDLFSEALGVMAVARREDATPGLVVSQEESWGDSSQYVRATCEIALLEHEDEAREPENDESTAEETFALCLTPTETYSELIRHAWKLVESPEIGIRAFWAAKVDPGSHPPAPRISSTFTATLRAFQYDHPGNNGRAASCFEAMVRVLANRPGDLASIDTHPHRTSTGGNAPAVTDALGRTLYRGKIFKGPNAHRLFWWGGTSPEFVGIAGHDDDPPI